MEDKGGGRSTEKREVGGRSRKMARNGLLQVDQGEVQGEERIKISRWEEER